MEEKYLNDVEKKRYPQLLMELSRLTANVMDPADRRLIYDTLSRGIGAGLLKRNRYGINPLVHSLETARQMCVEVGADRNIIAAILIHELCLGEYLSMDDIRKDWGDDTCTLVEGLIKIATLYRKQAAVMSENFRNLLLTFARDIRVIIIMIVERQVLMHAINHHPNENYVREVAGEANYLYAPLAHRLGLYKIKSDLEDLSLKYMDRETYTQIAHELNATKAKRDAYIADFIAPIKEKLEKSGLEFDIKGRTKSIYSIWNKIKKQNNDLEHIYDLFAIRVIIDAPPEEEKSKCWIAYSLITDMYTPNPARMKDWISIPKGNGYESLHITVKGPENKWVEVQIRTRRMDLIAEKGLAAHWKYKGIKSESNLDSWMNNIRDILETASSGPMELMKGIKMDLYSHEVFVFTPRGDLFRLPLGATVLDFAFSIHSSLGCSCTGAIVNGRHRKLNYKLQSGDTVEISTSSTQQPKLDWLNHVITQKARNKIRQSINESQRRAAELAKEMLQRRFKNRKIETDESTISRLIKKMGYKHATDFYNDLASEKIEVNEVIFQYEQLTRATGEGPSRSAGEFVMQQSPETATGKADDVLVIGDNIKGLNYKLALCCNPIYSDNIFGFVSAEGVIKIHRVDCPNARNIRARYPYRIIPARWSGKNGAQFQSTLRIIGNDDLGIVTNITSIIAKEKNAYLRNISIDSGGGMFSGFLIVSIDDASTLDSLIKKIKTIKGVKDVQRNL